MGWAWRGVYLCCAVLVARRHQLISLLDAVLREGGQHVPRHPPLHFGRGRRESFKLESHYFRHFVCARTLRKVVDAAPGISVLENVVVSKYHHGITKVSEFRAFQQKKKLAAGAPLQRLARLVSGKKNHNAVRWLNKKKRSFVPLDNPK